MTTWLVSRHAGALDWLAHQGVAADRIEPHFEPEWVAPGDTVIGTLPINLAAAVCERGGRYLHLTLEVPPEWRGRELTAAEMDAVGARLEGYRVEREGKRHHEKGPPRGRPVGRGGAATSGSDRSP